MATKAGVARHALLRQAWQSLLAAGVAIATVLVVVPLRALVNAAVDCARQRDVPLGKVPAMLVVLLLCVITAEELSLFMLQGKLRRWLLLQLVLLGVAAWAAAVAVATRLGVEEICEAGFPIFIVIYLITGPLAVFLRPGQSCRARLRRTARNLKAGLVRASAMSVAFTVILYVYLTISTQLHPALEVAIMGLGMPVLQAGCMSLLAWLLERHGTSARTAAERRASSMSMATQGAARSALAGKTGSSSSKPATGRRPASASGQSSTKKKKKISGEQMSLIAVLSAEVLYSTGAFATLILAESSRTFYLSLVSMLSVEVVQVALHVKARRVLSRVVAEGTAEALLGDNKTIRDWLLYQELGEKIGMLVALGFLGLLGVDEALGRGAARSRLQGATELTQRGVATVLLELMSDVGKDVVSQLLGVMPEGKLVGHVVYSPIGATTAMVMGLIGAFLVQVGLALDR